MIALAKENKDIIETVVVGNEALLRRDVSAAVGRLHRRG